MGQTSKVWEIGVALSGLILVGSLFVPRPADKAVFLDVGQGDSILFQEGTTQMLIDGGQGAAVLPRLGEELPWFDKTIDVVVMSHPQRDHLEGLLHVLERYHIGLAVFPEISYDSNLYREWLEQVRSRSIPFRFSQAGESIQFENMRAQVLAPFADPAGRQMARTNVNNASTTTRVDFCSSERATPRSSQSEVGCLSFLLSGDAEKPAEHRLVSRYAHPYPPQTADSPFVRGSKLLDVDVLKAGHHGSKTSTTQELLNAATPKAVVISVGAKNKFGHPAPEVLARLSSLPIFRTDQNGSVKFEHVGDQWLLKTAR